MKRIIVTVSDKERGIVGWSQIEVPDHMVSDAEVHRKITDWLRTYEDAYPKPEPKPAKPWWRFW